MSRLKNILVVFGTRPEAIKMAPVITTLRKVEQFTVRVCVTAQHRQMLDQVLDLFEIIPEYDLNLMRVGQGLSDITINVLNGLDQVLTTWTPDLMLVHGDTTTTLTASLAAFYRKIPVGHVEAGLRTGNIYAPWPEEMNRRLTAAIAAIHFAPTVRAAENLAVEGVAKESIHVTGNSVIDSLLEVAGKIRNNISLQTRLSGLFPWLDPNRRLILVTGHRRENFGVGFEQICQALLAIGKRPDVQIVYPVHLNPHVQEPVQRILAANSRIHLIDPLNYLPFVYLMMQSHFIITDSGGVQEEAPSLGKPVLVMRETTERPEALAAGTVKLVGTNYRSILEAATTLIDDSDEYQRMSLAHNPYGDGTAAQKITDIILGLQ